MIPIHNLTNNEYTIKPGEDLISVEFTKVSTNPAWKLTVKEIIETKIAGHFNPFSLSQRIRKPIRD